MAKISSERREVNARIVYWGIEGSGKSTNLIGVHSRLRPDHRGEVTEVPTRIDPTVVYEVVPIELGEIGGMRTRIELVAPPGSAEQAPTRKQLLDQVDGVVLVVDSQSHRIQENIDSFDELRRALADYGRQIDDVPFVIQYNKCDLADPLAIEDLHRQLDLAGVPVFETVASEQSGVLQTLTTISKRVIRSLRENDTSAGAAAAKPSDTPTEEEPTLVERPAYDPARESVIGDGVETELEPESDLGSEADLEPAVETSPQRVANAEITAVPDRPDREVPDSVRLMEEAILADAEHPDADEIDASIHDAETLLESTWDPVADEIERPKAMRLGPDLSIVSVGTATRAGARAVRVPLVLGDTEGRTASLTLTIQLDAVSDETDD